LETLTLPIINSPELITNGVSAEFLQIHNIECGDVIRSPCVLNK
jgi:hypothetical protein